MSTITRIKCITDNCYLISEGRNAILVDTGSGQCLDMDNFINGRYKNAQKPKCSLCNQK